jgi:indole-3-glycerol phosphate synthase
VNNRDLAAQKTDLATTERVTRDLPRGTPFVAESGITSRADVERVHRAGASAILVGEALLASSDIGAKVGELLGR